MTATKIRLVHDHFHSYDFAIVSFVPFLLLNLFSNHRAAVSRALESKDHAVWELVNTAEGLWSRQEFSLVECIL